MARIVVVGGGVAGLAAAWQLAGAGSIDGGGERPEVIVLEQSGSLGGKLRLGDVGGQSLDVGAESVLVRRPEAVDLLSEVGAAHLLVHPAPVGADLVHEGRRWPLPRGTVMGVPGSTEGLLGLFTESEVARIRSEDARPLTVADISVGDLVDQRLGAAVTDRLVEPLLAGVYAGSSRRISAQVAVPALLDAATAGRSLVESVAALTTASSASGPSRPVFAGIDGGLGLLPGLLADALRAKGVRMYTGVTVRRLARAGSGWVLTHGPTTAEEQVRADAVVLAVPAAPAARLLAPVAASAANELGGIDYASVAIVTYAFDAALPELAGRSGFLVPPADPLSIKASTFSSVKWPWLGAARPDMSFVRVSFGRHGEVRSLQVPDEELERVGLRDLSTVLGTQLPRPRAAMVTRWGGGLPQYAVGHRDRVTRIRAGLPRGVVVCGAAYDGVGIPACIGSARGAAIEVLTGLA